METKVLKILPCGCKILATRYFDIEYCEECWREIVADFEEDRNLDGSPRNKECED